MTIKDFIIKVFTNKWKYKLVAIAAALILWFYVAKDQSYNIIIDAPLKYENLSANMTMLNSVDQSVKLTLTGRRDIITRLNKRDIKVFIDMKASKPGENIYKINAEDIKAIPRGVDITNMMPSQIEVILKQEVTNKEIKNGKALR